MDAVDRIQRATAEDNIASHTERSSVALFTPAYAVGNAMGGVGVRVWELAQALAASVDVQIVARGPFDLAAPGVSFVDAADEGEARAALDRAAAVVFYDLPDTREMLRLYRQSAMIVSEISPPIEHLGYHAIRSAPDPDGVYADLVSRYELQVLLSDHFLLQSAVARAMLIASLCHLGRLTRRAYDDAASLAHAMSPLPLGFSRAANEAMRRAAPTLPVVDFTWSGGIWDYYDPVALVRAVAALERKGRPITLRFLYPAPSDQVLKEAKELVRAIAAFHLEDRVQFSSNPPGHAQRDGALLSSRALVCIAKPGIENATCVRLRLRDTLLYGLPLVVDPFGPTATEVRALGIGVVADPRDARELADALEALAHDDRLYRELSNRLLEVRQRFVIDDYVHALLDVIREGRRASDRDSVAHARRVSDLLSRHPALWKPPVQPW